MHWTDIAAHCTVLPHTVKLVHIAPTSAPEPAADTSPPKKAAMAKQTQLVAVVAVC